jgi:hypothetical protein
MIFCAMLLLLTLSTTFFWSLPVPLLTTRIVAVMASPALTISGATVKSEKEYAVTDGVVVPEEL